MPFCTWMRCSVSVVRARCSRLVFTNRQLPPARAAPHRCCARTCLTGQQSGRSVHRTQCPAKEYSGKMLMPTVLPPRRPASMTALRCGAVHECRLMVIAASVEPRLASAYVTNISTGPAVRAAMRSSRCTGGPRQVIRQPLPRPDRLVGLADGCVAISRQSLSVARQSRRLVFSSVLRLGLPVAAVPFTKSSVVVSLCHSVIPPTKRSLLP